jgi:hypothetical protein
VYSNLPLLVELWSPNVTLEGDAMVMYQQTGKVIFKLLKKIARGQKIIGTFAYLHEIDDFENAQKIDDVYDIDFLTDVIKISALYQISKTNKLLKSDDGLEWSSKWNKKYQIDVVKAVKLHSVYTTASIFVEEVRSVSVNHSLKEKLIILCKIYC